MCYFLLSIWARTTIYSWLLGEFFFFFKFNITHSFRPKPASLLHIHTPFAPQFSSPFVTIQNPGLHKHFEGRKNTKTSEKGSTDLLSDPHSFLLMLLSVNSPILWRPSSYALKLLEAKGKEISKLPHCKLITLTQKFPFLKLFHPKFNISSC